MAKLQSAAYICIILGFLLYAGETIMESVQALTGAATGGLEMAAYTNVETAFVTLTNRKKVTQWACLKGEVTGRTSQDKISSAVVCSGEMKPMTTVTLQAPYPVGKVRDLCSTTDRLGIKTVDWSLCAFEMTDLSYAPK